MSSYKVKKSFGDVSWFTHDRFGMFIHFGLYSMPARHEWVKCAEQPTEEKYDVYFDLFNPDLLDAKYWAKRAKECGMKYAILTTKHHEGFCLFDSKFTDYKVTNTPYGKDIVKEYADAFRAEGLHVGFYYSLLDWHHPEFTLDRFHPRRFDENAKEMNAKRDMRKYAKYMRDQVTELLTNYGKIDIIWFDMSYPNPEKGNFRPHDFPKGKGKDDWEAEELIKTARSLQPDIIIDNRTGIDQDIYTPEQYQPLEWVKHPTTGELVTWEACHTFSGSWGYFRDETTWKSPETLIGLLVNTVSVGGNLIMNVGPTARGTFDYRAENSLDVYKEWMKYNSRSIYGCTMAEPEFIAPRGTRLTQSEDGKRLYVHLVEYPFEVLEMRGMAGKIKYVQFLHDASELIFHEKSFDHCSMGRSEGDDLVFIKIPHTKPNVIVPVIEIFLK